MVTDEVGVMLKYPSIDEVFAVFSEEDTEDIFKLVIGSIEAIYNSEDYWESKDQTKEEIEEFIYSLTKEQFSRLEVFFTSSPKIVQTIECDCPKCGKHNVSRLEGLQNFFV